MRKFDWYLVFAIIASAAALFFWWVADCRPANMTWSNLFLMSATAYLAYRFLSKWLEANKQRAQLRRIRRSWAG